MDKNNSFTNRTFNSADVFSGSPSKVKAGQNTLKLSYINADGAIRVYHSPTGTTWEQYDEFMVSGNSSSQASINAPYYYVRYEHDGAAAQVSLVAFPVSDIKLTADDTVIVSGLNFNEDGQLLVSGIGGGGGSGDASASNQLTQIEVAEASNVAIFQQLADQTDRLLYDTDIIANNITDSNVSVCTRIDNSNVAQMSQLTIIREASEISASWLQGIYVKQSAVPRQTAYFTIEAQSTLAPDTSPAFKAPPEQLKKSQGWYYKNTSGSQASQLYYFSYLNLQQQVPARQGVYTIADITGAWAIVKIMNLNSSEGLPFMAKYSQINGVGDYQTWYKSRWVYTIPTSQKLIQGQEVMLYWGLTPDARLYPDVRRVELQLSEQLGTALGTENLSFLTLNTATNAPVGHAEYCVRAAGWQWGGQNHTEIVLTGETQTELTSLSDARAEHQLASNVAICSRLENSNVVLGSMDISLNNIEVKLDDLAFTGSNLQVQDIKLSSELASLNSVIQQGLPVVMDSSPPVSGGMRLFGEDSNLFVRDKEANASIIAVKDEIFALNGAVSSLISGDSQLYIKVDALNDDSVGIYGYSPSLSMPEAIYTVDNSAKVYVDNVVNSLILAKNSVDNNVNLLVDAEQRLLSNTVIVGTVPVSIADTVDTHLYAEHNSTWQSVKAAASGHLLVNSVLETDANGALTSTVNDDVNALDVQVQNIVSANLRTSVGGLLTSTSGGTTNSLDVAIKAGSDLKTSTGLLTSSVSGTGNSINSLDVAVKNNVAIENVSNSQLAVKVKQFGSYNNLVNNETIAPYSAGTQVLNIADWSYIVGYYTDIQGSYPTYPDNRRLQFSFDGITWVNLFNLTINVSELAGVNVASIYKTDVPGVNYVRFYNDTNLTLASVNCTIVGATCT